MASPSFIPANPFAAPSSPIGPVVASTADPAVVALRRRYVRHERAVQTLGLLMYVLAAWFAIASIAFPPGTDARRAATAGRAARSIGAAAGRVGVEGACVCLLARVGFGLRRLREWARQLVLIPTALAILGLFAVLFVEACHFVAYFMMTWALSEKERFIAVLATSIPPALVISYLGFLLGSERGTAVFSDPYRAAVAATPELDPPASLIVRLWFGLLMGLAGVALLTLLGNLLFFG